MQTFLPYESFAESARCLDRQRLGKQRVETLQLLKANFGLTKGWVNHPAAVMWRGYELALCTYGIAMCDEWEERGYKDTCAPKMVLLTSQHCDISQEPIMPPWLGGPIHKSHRSNLLRKNPEHYASWFGPKCRPDIPYYWPNQGEE